MTLPSRLRGPLLFAGVLLACLLCLEGTLRALGPAPQPVTSDIFRNASSLYLPNAKGSWRGHMGVMWEYDTVVTTNSMALHDSQHTVAKADDTYRILVIGDSFVEAWQVPLEQTFFKLLERGLAPDAQRLFGKKKVEVIAIGHSGHGSIKELEELTGVGLAYSPDLVLTLMLLQNDLKDDLFLMDRRKRPERYRPGTMALPVSDATASELRFYKKLLILPSSAINRWAAFAVYRLIRQKRMTAESRKVYLDDAGIYGVRNDPVFKGAVTVWEGMYSMIAGNYAQMQRLCADKGARFAAVLINDAFVYDNGQREALFRAVPEFRGKLDFEKPAREVKKRLGSAQVPYLDMTPGFAERFRKDRKPTRYRDDGHWNEHGHGIAAELIENFIRDRFSNK